MTVDEFLDWQAYWELEPWGELRADLRQAAGLAISKAEWLPADAELPEFTYPYWDTAEETQVDLAERQRMIAEHTQRWAEWEQERRRGNLAAAGETDQAKE